MASSSRPAVPPRLPHRTVTTDATTGAFFEHSSAHRVNTDAVIAKSLKEEYPGLELIIAPQANCDLLSFAQTGHATFTPIEQPKKSDISSLTWKEYAPPARRINGHPGALLTRVLYGGFMYKWNDEEFILYMVDGRDGTSPYPQLLNNYILTSSRQKAEALILAAGQWSYDLHDEIWVFDQGMWQKSAELFQSVKKASWDAVILDEGMKKALIEDHLSFFESRETYTKLSVPWKRGVIYYGPPGNGKTISIKAMMHGLLKLKTPVVSLYVRSLVSVR
jgi:transitional endoplasmic reticulum ATPase